MSMKFSKECLTFTEEAFIYLLDYFRVKPVAQKNFTVFTEEMGHAILTIGYIWRRRWRALFNNSLIDWSDIYGIQKYALEFKPLRDNCYFFRMLMWISQIFELAFRCSGELHNYIEAASRTIREETSEECFQANGGYSRLQETACFINKVYERMQPAIEEEDPRNKVLKRFVDAVECLEKSSGTSMTDQLGKLISSRDSVLRLARVIGPDDAPFIRIIKYMMCLRFQSTYFLRRGTVGQPCTALELCAVGYLNDPPPFQTEQREICELFGELLRRQFPRLENNFLASYDELLFIQSAACRHLTDMIFTTIDISAKENPTFTASASTNPPVNRFYYKVPAAYIAEVQRKVSPEKAPTWTSNVGNALVFKWILHSNIRQKRVYEVYEQKKGSEQVITHAVYTEHCSYDHNTNVVIFKDADQ